MSKQLHALFCMGCDYSSMPLLHQWFKQAAIEVNWIEIRTWVINNSLLIHMDVIIYPCNNSNVLFS